MKMSSDQLERHVANLQRTLRLARSTRAQRPGRGDRVSSASALLAGTARRTLWIVSCCALSGCATLANGTSQRIPVSTTPAGARVEVDGNSYTTPVELELTRKTYHIATISMPGYHSIRVVFRSGLNTTSASVAGLGGISGAMIDSSTGSANELLPARVDAVLEAVAPGTEPIVLDWPAAPAK